VRKYRQNPAVTDVPGPAFAEIHLAGQTYPNPSVALRIVLPCGTVIELASRVALPLALELLSNLRRPC
jgi:hypothetical protein